MTRKEYEETRNKLIPKAVEYANKEVEGKGYSGDEYDTRWTRKYHNIMNILAFEAGLAEEPIDYNLPLNY